MIKKGIVKNVQANGTWNSDKYGILYKFEVTIGDDTGQTMSKTDKCKFEVGQETEYEFIDGKYPQIKRISNFQQGGYKPQPKNDNVQEYIIKQNALTNATSFVCNNGGSPTDVLEIAEIFSNWVLNNVKPKSTSNGNDLPF